VGSRVPSQAEHNQDATAGASSQRRWRIHREAAATEQVHVGPQALDVHRMRVAQQLGDAVARLLSAPSMLTTIRSVAVGSPSWYWNALSSKAPRSARRRASSGGRHHWSRSRTAAAWAATGVAGCGPRCSVRCCCRCVGRLRQTAVWLRLPRARKSTSSSLTRSASSWWTQWDASGRRSTRSRLGTSSWCGSASLGPR
jgi:hypothetical protein